MPHLSASRCRARREGSKKEHSRKACRVPKERSDITKQQRKLKGEQPRNGVERGGMRCTEAHHPIRYPRGTDRSAQQKHEHHAKHSACDKIACPMKSKIK